MCEPTLIAAGVAAAGSAYSANQQKQAQKAAIAEARRAEEEAKAQAAAEQRRVDTNIFRTADEVRSRGRRGFALRLFPEAESGAPVGGSSSAPPTLGV